MELDRLRRKPSCGREALQSEVKPTELSRGASCRVSLLQGGGCAARGGAVAQVPGALLAHLYRADEQHEEDELRRAKAHTRAWTNRLYHGTRARDLLQQCGWVGDLRFCCLANEGAGSIPGEPTEYGGHHAEVTRSGENQAGTDEGGCQQEVARAGIAECEGEQDEYSGGEAH